jgi:hypothetical protein
MKAQRFLLALAAVAGVAAVGTGSIGWREAAGGGAAVMFVLLLLLPWVRDPE